MNARVRLAALEVGGAARYVPVRRGDPLLDLHAVDRGHVGKPADQESPAIRSERDHTSLRIREEKRWKLSFGERVGGRRPGIDCRGLRVHPLSSRPNATARLKQLRWAIPSVLDGPRGPSCCAETEHSLCHACGVVLSFQSY